MTGTAADRAVKESATGRRRKGRPRPPETDRSIVRAAIELMTEGGSRAATIDAIARRSGCAKTTIYRRWPSRDALLLHAFRVSVQGTADHVEEVGDLSRALGSTVHGSARNILALVRSPTFRAAFPTLSRELLGDSPLGDRFRSEVFQPIRALGRERLRAEVGRDEIRADVDLDLVLDLVNGAMLYRALVGEPLDDRIADEIADLVLSGAAAPAQQGGRAPKRRRRSKPSAG